MDILKIFPNLLAIVFDFDGVIVDTEYMQLIAWSEVARRRKIDPDEIRLADTAGMSDHAIAQILQSKVSESPEVLISEKEKLTQKHLIKNGIQPIKGAPEFIRWACQLFILAVASSSSESYLKQALTSLELLDCFNVIVGADNFSTKPDPAVYKAAVRLLKIEPNRCIAIEDTPTGLESAKRAGLFTIGISGTFQSIYLEQSADFVVDSFATLKKTVQCMEAWKC